MTGDKSRRKMLIGLGAITLVGLALRLLIFLGIWGNGGNQLIGDEGNYVEAALALARGQGIPDNWLWIRPPGFIVVAAAVFRLFDGSLAALNLLQITFSTASIPLLFLLTRLGLRQVGYEARIADRAALLAATILAINPSLALAANFFLTETLFIFLLLLLSLLLLLMWQPGQRRVALLAAGAGLVGGAALLVRANSLTFLLPLALLLIVLLPGSLRRRIGLVALFGACVGLMLVPWTVRNELHYGRFLPLETTGPYNIYLDNNDVGRKAIDAQLWQVENPADRGGVALAGAIDWITTHPADFASRVGRRFVASVAPDDYSEAGYPLRDKIPGSPATWHDVFSFGATLGYLLLVGLAFVGWLATRRGVLWWLTTIYVGAYVLAAGLTHNEFRYRLQLFPFLVIYAALVFADPGALFGRVRRAGAIPRWLAFGGVAVALIWVVLGLPNIVTGVARTVQTANYLRDADASGPQALAAAEAAAQVNPTSGAVWRRYAVLLAAAGRAEDAAAAFRHALDFEPADYQTRALYAAALRQSDPAAAAKVVAAVPPAYNLALQSWAWENLGRVPAAQLDVGGDDLGLVRGFFPPEDDASGFNYRWMTGEGSIRLAAVQGAELRFTARALPPASGEPRPVQVLLNGTPVANVALGAGWQEYTVELPGANSGSLEIGFKASADQASPQDTRRLSIAIDKASLSAP